MSVLYFSLLALLSLTISNRVSRSDRQDDLREINKHTLLTIQGLNGDIIDCVDQNKQSAFNNPLLKNHTIQSLSEEPKKVVLGETNTFTPEISQTLISNESRCPKGSVPILRTVAKNITQSNPSLFGNKSYSSSSRVFHMYTHDHGSDYKGESEYVLGSIRLDGKKIKGIKVKMSVWHPDVEGDNEFSSAQVRLLAGDGDQLNIVGAGWHVHPGVYWNKDRSTRFFGYWTRDNSMHTGGYNFRGDGFIAVDEGSQRGMYLGYRLATSLYNDYNQRDIYVSIKKEIVEGKVDAGWWLRIDGIRVGYWPVEIFTHLKDGLATKVELVGQVKNVRSNNGRHTTTQMGSGHFADEGFTRAAFFANLEVINDIGDPAIVPYDQLVTGVTQLTNEHCYSVEKFDYIVYGTGFFYGGPGYDKAICP